MQGKFIVIEGPDGSGTTTQSTILARLLQEKGYVVTLTREPSTNAIGKLIRTLLSGKPIPADALQLLFTADRALHLAEVIKPALHAGHVVVCEQYTLSTLLFGAAAGLDRSWLMTVNGTFLHPDIEVILLPPFTECVRRWSARESQEFLEEHSFQQRVYDEYATHAVKYDIAVFDTSRQKDTVSQAILTHILQRLPSPSPA